MTQCIYCNRKVIKYRVSRDWSTRNSHYKCWKNNEDEWSIKFAIEQYIKDTSM